MQLVCSWVALAAATLCSVVLSPCAQAEAKVRIVVSVDWEGRDLAPANLAAIQQFRSDFADIPLQHFLNAAYYTKPDANQGEVTRAITSVLRKGDEHGLHLHGWMRLFEAAGVSFRTGPTYLKDPVDLRSCRHDCGHEVAITAYREDELRRVIRFASDTLEGQGFDRPHSFRAGGWQADAKVLRALAREGFTVDSSATHAKFLEPAWGGTNLYTFVRQLWASVVPTTQPYVVDLGGGDRITELVNNGCLADYMTGKAMLEVFRGNAAALGQVPDRDVYVSIGFHQETAAKYLPALRDGITRIKEYGTKRGIPFEFIVDPVF